jgi:3-oxoacyl-[acyl-carrier protein] reductase
MLSAAGYKLALLDQDASALAEAERRCQSEVNGVITLSCDLGDPNECRQAIAELHKLMGPPDILINNAAIYPTGPWDQISLEAWNRVLAVNLSAAFLLAQLTASHMIEQGWGRMVNVSSITFHVGMRDRPHYIASKGGLVGLTRALARELGNSAVTVNCVTPGAIRTPAEIGILGSEEKLREWDAWLYERQCLLRRGLPTDIAHAIMFLISDGASFITAQDVVVDGGWSPT